MFWIVVGWVVWVFCLWVVLWSLYMCVRVITTDELPDEWKNARQASQKRVLVSSWI